MGGAKALIINRVEFPVAYNGYTISRNKIWSRNTGRNDYGDMVGTIIAIKNKVEIQLVPLTPAQAGVLDAVVSDIDNPFPTAEILFVDGTRKQITIYTGDISYPWLSTSLGDGGLITGVKLSAIEK